MANTNWANAGHFYAPQVKPVLLTCNFVVDSTNGNGLGIRSLKGAGVKNVFMHTSATPGSNAGYLNPNPAAGNILINLQGNFNRFLAGFAGFVEPVSGTPLTATVANSTYVIVSLGTATTAQWVAVGVPIGVTPAVGLAFIATASATIGGGAAVEVPLATGSGIDHIEVVGDPNVSIGGLAPAGPTGAFLVNQCFLGNTLTQPANGSVISLSFYLSDSAITVSGQ